MTAMDEMDARIAEARKYDADPKLLKFLLWQRKWLIGRIQERQRKESMQARKKFAGHLNPVEAACYPPSDDIPF